MIDVSQDMLGAVFLFYYHPAKFVGLASCDSENKIFLICHVTTQSKYQVTLWVGSVILSYYHVKLGIHRPCESGDATLLFVISVPIPVPMPRFQPRFSNGH